MTVNPHYTINTLPPVDILIIPGGDGTEREMFNKKLIDFIRIREPQVEYLLSVCTGSFLLGMAGLLDGLKTTTHHRDLDLLQEHVPKTTVIHDARVVDNGKVVCAAGVSSGIDMSLHMVEKIVGKKSLDAAVTRMEYDYQPERPNVWVPLSFRPDNSPPPTTIAILIFDDVEVLDFCGPFEVFGIARQLCLRDGAILNSYAFNVILVAEKHVPIITRGGMSVNPHYSIENLPPVDILLVPGGQGTRREMFNEKLLAFIQKRAAEVQYLLTVCTGSLLLGRAGLLDGLATTTHQRAIDLLRQHTPNATVVDNCRIVDNGRIVCSGGISAGIDMSLYMVQRLVGKGSVDASVERMEYEYHPKRSAVWRLNEDSSQPA
eukprot:TRINITY_DN4652_c0_g1_i2.p1 TRINITY_DN4652_c0_g1~~TRINITY_DN4652_c0_g1_i2.p1  ORF type:complete len:375 (+),score=66.77 TRINITY_DN4652_c0_g1_i2:180-1304(+)